MWRIRWNNRDIACFGFARFAADGERRGSFQHEDCFDVRMRVERRAFPRRRVDEVSRDRRALFFAMELVRHSFERQLIHLQEAHC